MASIALALCALCALAPLGLMARKARLLRTAGKMQKKATVAHEPVARQRTGLVNGVVRGLFGLNGILLLAALLLGSRLLFAPVAQAAPGAQGTTAQGTLSGTVALAAALSTGLATIGAGIAVGMTGSAALGTIAERPETFGRALIFVGLSEGIAIYGLIMSFLIISR